MPVLEKTKKLIRHLLKHRPVRRRHNEKEKVNSKRTRGRKCKSFFEEIFQRMEGLRHANQSRSQQVTDTNDYKYKAWFIETTDNEIIVVWTTK